MIYSTQHNKNTNEDPKTSVVFENLMLLPDNVFWEILKTAASNKGVLSEDAGLLFDNFCFWPKWNPDFPYKTGNASYVEPDVFFSFENIDVIVEAKYSDNDGQYREEWEREFKAYLNEHEDDKKKVVLLAVGGNPSFEKEQAIKVGRRSCPIVKYSWVGLLNTALDFEKNEISDIEDVNKSSMKRIIRNLEIGCQNIGLYRNNKKMEIKGLSDIFILGKIFQASITRETESYTLIYYHEDMNSSHYGYQFEVKPKDGRKKSIWLSVAFWMDDEEVIAIEARDIDNWAGKLCQKIKDGVKFSSKYATKPQDEGNRYYFYAKEKLYLNITSKSHMRFI